MAQNLPYIRVPPNQWIDLYDESSIPAGFQIIIQNVGGYNARLVESTAEPDISNGYNVVIPRAYLTNEPRNIGAWAWSKTGTTLQVEIL